MSINGFLMEDGSIDKYDYNALLNKPANADGLSQQAKQALLECFRNVAWINANGQTYYDALEAALASAATFSITNNLTGCSTSNIATSVTEGSSYSATITASSGYTLDGATVNITMGGTSVTGFYSNGTISIPNVTGDIVITVTAVSAVTSITAVFTQGDNVIYETDSLDTLKQYLVVTANYSDSTSAAVSDYTLSGTLTEGTSAITVSYGGKTDTFDAVISQFIGAYWDYTLGRLPSLELDGISTNLTNSPSVTFVEGTGIHYVGKGDSSNTNVRYGCENYITARKSKFEVDFIVRSAQGTSEVVPFALSTRLSNGTTGVNTSVAVTGNGDHKFLNVEGSSATATRIPDKTWAFDTEYTLRIEYTDGGTQYFYLNDELIYSTTNVSSYYTTANRFYIQGNGVVDIRSFRWTIMEV